MPAATAVAAGLPSPDLPMIAVIGGTGHQGLGLAMRWAAAGVPVIIGSRSPERARDAAERVRAATAGPVDGAENLQAARAADVIVVTVPAEAHAATLTAIAPATEGKVVVDVTVPLGSTPSDAVQLPEGSAAEAAQRFFGAGVRVVGAFHSVPAALLLDLARPVDCDVLVCGDDRQAKARVIDLATAFGARALDVGALRQTHTLERLTALLIGLGRRVHRHDLGIRITGL
jgi:8-hydroxy-5-deazaflavin:NADPH oxidoreductase